MAAVEAAYCWVGLARKVAFRQLYDYHDAQDVAQDVFVTLLERPARLTGRSPAAVVRTIALGRSIDVWRTRQLHRGRTGRRDSGRGRGARRNFLTYVREDALLRSRPKDERP